MSQGPDAPGAVSPGKAALNLGVGLYGLYGGVPGLIIGAVYFLGEATGTWDALGNLLRNKSGKPVPDGIGPSFDDIMPKF